MRDKRKPNKPAAQPLQPAPLAGRFETPRMIQLGALLLAVLVFAAYHNSFQVPFVFDDIDSITRNASLRNWSTAFFPPTEGGVTVAGRPILNATLALNWAMSGNEVTRYHVTNVLIHALAALVLWGVVRRTLTLPSLSPQFGKDATLLGWMAAALWALHPLQTESVTYTVQRAESLVGLFFLLTLYAFVRSTQSTGAHWKTLSFTACVLGMATKEIMIAAPVLVLLYDRTFVSGTFAETWRKRGGFHLSLASTWVLLACLIATTSGRGGSVGFGQSITWWDYLCTQSYAIARYLFLSVIPAGLTLDYGVKTVTDLRVVIPCGILVIALLTLTVRGIQRRAVSAFFGAWFFAILAPTSSFIPVATQTIAEHRMYLPLAALTVGGVLGLRQLSQRHTWVITRVLLVVFGLVTMLRNEAYRSAESIWQDTVEKQPSNWRALNNLGSAVLLDKRPNEAIPIFEKALSLNFEYAESHASLAQALVNAQRASEALPHAERALALAPEKIGPNATYGNVLTELGRSEEGIPYLQKALSKAPDDLALHFNLANAYGRARRSDEAIQQFATAIALKPDDVDALNNFGALLRTLGRIDEAVDQYRKALRFEPDSSNTHNNLGVALVVQGNLEEGLQHLRTSVLLAPKVLEARQNLTRALAQAGRIEEAIAEGEEAAKLKPDADLLNNLGTLYGQSGKLNEAEGAFRRALEVQPQHPGARENLGRLEAYLRALGSR